MKNTYNETKLTPEIRDKSKALLIIISSWLREIEMPLHPINYIIHLEGKTKLINLRVYIYNRDIQEQQKFIKLE